MSKSESKAHTQPLQALLPQHYLLVLIALGLEALAVTMLAMAWSHGPGNIATPAWFAFFGLHALACFILAFGLKPLGIGLFALIFGLSLPLLGMLGIAFTLWPALQRRRQPQSSQVQTLPAIKSVIHYAAHFGSFGPGGFSARLLCRNLSATQRLPLLLALGRHANAFANRLLRELLRDPDDEIRLAAYALLERREKETQNTLQLATENLQKTQGPEARLIALRQLAFAHWNAVYQEQVAGEGQSRHLHAARDAADQALRLKPQDAGLLALSGRIRLRLGDWPGAARAFTLADEAGAPTLRSLPYQAEIAFRQGDFAALRKHLLGLRRSTAPDGNQPMPIPFLRLEKLMRFWCGPSLRESA